MTGREKRDSLTAAGITLAAILLLVLLLVFCSLQYDGRDMAAASTPEIGLMPEEEELLIEPELLREQGEPNAVTEQEAAPSFKGNPEPAPEENTRKVVKGTNPKPAPAESRKVDTKKESPVKSTTPSKTDEETQKAKSKTAKAFGGVNGDREGKKGTSGAGGVGTGKSGVASGRTFKGCPDPKVTLRNRVTVVVTVEINAEGQVTSARAKGGAPADIRRACEAAARQARWSKKADAPLTRGTITFTITPR